MPNHRNRKGKSKETAVIVLNYSNHKKRTIEKEIETAVNFALKLSAISLAMQFPDLSMPVFDHVRDNLIEIVRNDPTFFVTFNVWFALPARSLPTPHGHHQSLFQNSKSAISKDSAPRHPRPGRPWQIALETVSQAHN
jgi:hypothetical protein